MYDIVKINYDGQLLLASPKLHTSGMQTGEHDCLHVDGITLLAGMFRVAEWM